MNGRFDRIYSEKQFLPLEVEILVPTIDPYIVTLY